MPPSNAKTVAKNQLAHRCTWCEDASLDPIWIVGLGRREGISFCQLRCIESWIYALLEGTEHAPR